MMKTFILLIVLSLNLNVKLLADTNNHSESLNEKKSLTLDQVIQLENSGQSMEALLNVKELYIQDPSKIAYFNTYMRLLIKNNKIEALNTLLNQESTANKNDWQEWQPWFWLGTGQLLLGNINEASFCIDEALAKEGNNPAIWIQKAIIEQEKNNYETAINLLQIADSLEPNNPEVLINYAYAVEKTGKIEKAIQAYNQFLKTSVSQKKWGRLRAQVMLRLSQIETIKRNFLNQKEE